MFNLRRFIGATAVAVAAVGIGVLPSVVSAQNGPAQGTLTVAVDLTGDSGGNPAAIAFLVVRNTTTGNNDTVVSGTGQASPQAFTVDAGAYLISASTSNPDDAVTGISCIENPPNNGPGTPDFIVPSNGTVTCTITAAYTAPPPSTSPPTTEVPGDTTTTQPGATTTDAGATTTTTVDQGALAPSAGGTAGGTSAGTIPVTGPSGQTAAIAVAALGMLMLGAGALTVARRR